MLPQQLLLGAPVGTTAGAILGAVDVVYPTNADYTLTTSGTAPQSTNKFQQVTSAVPLTATRKYIVPLFEGQDWTVQNLTTGGQDILVIGPSGTGVLVPNGSTAAVTCDGTNILVPSAAGGAAPGTAAYNSNWYAAGNIYLDPVSGNDTNSGLSSGTAIKTAAEMIRRFGSNAPYLSASLTINQLSTQTSGVDEFFFNPQLADGISFVWAGTTTNVGASFHPNSVTAKSVGSAGNQWSLNGNLPAGAAVGQLVHNTSRNSYAWIESISGGNATVSQPLPATPGSEDNSWTAGNSYQLLVPPFCNWRNPCPSGTLATGSASCFIELVTFMENSASTQLAFHPFGESILLYFCSFLPPTSLCGVDVPMVLPPIPPGGSTYAFFAAYGCYFAEASVPASVYLDSVFIIGGAAAGAVYAKDSAFVFDFFFSSNSTLTGNNYIGSAEIGTGATLSVVEGVTSIQLTGFSQILWGPGTVNVTNGAHLVNGSGGAWANAALQVATVQTDGHTTAWTPPVTGTFVNNGAAQVTTTGVSGTNAFPANAPISWALQTVGGAITAQPYFSQAQAAKNFYTQASAGDTSTYAWTAGPGTDTLSAANLDVYLSMNNPYTGSSYSKAGVV